MSIQESNFPAMDGRSRLARTTVGCSSQKSKLLSHLNAITDTTVETVYSAQMADGGAAGVFNCTPEARQYRDSDAHSCRDSNCRFRRRSKLAMRNPGESHEKRHSSSSVLEKASGGSPTVRPPEEMSVCRYLLVYLPPFFEQADHFISAGGARESSLIANLVDEVVDPINEKRGIPLRSNPLVIMPALSDPFRSSNCTENWASRARRSNSGFTPSQAKFSICVEARRRPSLRNTCPPREGALSLLLCSAGRRRRRDQQESQGKQEQEIGTRFHKLAVLGEIGILSGALGISD